MSLFTLQFLSPGAHGDFRDGYDVDSWPAAYSFVRWEREQGVQVRLSLVDGEVLEDPASIQTLADFNLKELGFLPGCNSIARGVILRQSMELESCFRSRCRICGHIGTEYEGFYLAGTLYRPSTPACTRRAFSVCPVCADTREFPPPQSD